MNSTDKTLFLPQRDFPFFKEVSKRFPVIDTVAFAYDKHIYTNTNWWDIRQDLIVHESTHLKQQHRDGMTPDKWWRKYMDDPVFRLTQEVEAYTNQIAYIKTKDRNLAIKAAKFFAEQLSSPLYGNIIPASKAFDVLVFKKPLF